MNNDNFDLWAYQGTWYELMHSPTWFESSVDFNTKANYKILKNGLIRVINTTYNGQQKLKITGLGKYCGQKQFQVIFPPISTFTDTCQPNYIIDKIWYDDNGDYLAVIITNPQQNYFSLLSRLSSPSLSLYSEMITTVQNRFPTLPVIQTPHYSNC